MRTGISPQGTPARTGRPVPEVSHVVGWRQRIRDRLGFVPWSLCGTWLGCDRCLVICTCVTPESPVCPLCALIAGWH
jgi:hypothetical protein